jgi:hypothetical protein
MLGMTEGCAPPPLILPPGPDRLPLIREAFRLEERESNG